MMKVTDDEVVDKVTDDGPDVTPITAAVLVTVVVAFVLFCIAGVVYETGYREARERAAHLAGAMGHPEVAKAIQELP